MRFESKLQKYCKMYRLFSGYVTKTQHEKLANHLVAY